MAKDYDATPGSAFDLTGYDPGYSDYLSRLQKPAAKPAPTSRTKGEIASDIGAEIMGNGVSVVEGGQGLLNWATGRKGEDKYDSELISSAKDYWQDAKSDYIKKKEAGLTDAIQDPNKSVFEYMWDNPELVPQMVAGSVLPMMVSGGAAGMGAKGLVAMNALKAGSKATPYVLAGLSGASEGALMAGDVYNETESGWAAAGALGLGTITGGIGGNVGLGVARRAVGKEILGEGVESMFNKSIGRRALTSMFGEGGQEYIQEGGQALLEMGGKGEELDLMQAAKRATVGAIVGAAAGGGFHPMFGDSRPEFKTVADRDAAIQLADEKRWQEYLVAKGAVGGQPTIGEFEALASDPAFLRRNSEVALAAQAAANAEAVLQANPNDPEAQELAASTRAAFVAISSTPAEREQAAKVQSAGTAAAVMGATSVEGAIEQHLSGQQANSTLTTGATAVEAVKQIAAAANPITSEPIPLQGGGEIIEVGTKQYSPAILAAQSAALAGGVSEGYASTIATETNPERLRVHATSSNPLISGLARAVIQSQVAPTAAPAPAPVAVAPAAAPAPTPAPAPATKTVTTSAALPKELAGASPRYKTDKLEFETDIDKAAYIAAQAKPSKRDADYLNFVMAATGMSEAEVRAHGAKVRAAIKGLAAEGGRIRVPNQLAQKRASAFDKIKAIYDESTLKLSFPAVLRSILEHDFTGSKSPIIRIARQLNEFDTLPASVKYVGVTEEEWQQFRDEVKDKIGATRTAGVQSKIEEGVTAGGMLDYLIANGEPRISKMAAALKRFGEGNPYAALVYENMVRAPGKQTRGMIKSWVESGEVTSITNVAGKADEITTLHEITHLLTQSWLNTVDHKNPLYRELSSMRNAAKAHWEKTHTLLEDKPYGLTNNAEFMAEAMANQQFQDFLRTVPATRAKNGWEAFVSWVKDVIGDPELDLNMLGQALATIEKAATASTAKAKDVEANKITGGGQISTPDDISDMASRDPLVDIVDRVFGLNDPAAIDKLIDTNEAVANLDRAGLQEAASGPRGIRATLAKAYINRADAGYDDAFDVVAEQIELLDQEEGATSMNTALGIDNFDPEYAPDMGGNEGMEDYSGPEGAIPAEQTAMISAIDQMWNAGGNSRVVIQRTLAQSATELRLVARAAGNGARSALARAMLEFANLEDAQVFGDEHLLNLMNENIAIITTNEAINKESDPEPAYAAGGRKPLYDFKARLTNAYRTGALGKLAAFWQNLMSMDGQVALKTDAQSILKGKDSTNVEYAALVEAYNDELFEKAKAWAREHNHPEPHDKPSNRIIGILKTGKNDMGKPIVSLTLSGRGRGWDGYNPYLPSTAYRTNATMDLNPFSKMNEIHTIDLAGYPGAADVAYRIFADVAKAHELKLPTSDTLMTNNNVRRPWQTVAASLRLSDPEVLSPLNAGNETSAYGMDVDLWPHLNDQERIGANILRHVHNALVSRPGNMAKYAKTVVSNGRKLDNLSPSPDGKGFVATHEPNVPNGVKKGEKVDMEAFTVLLKSAKAIGGDSQTDADGARKGMGTTSMAFAIMSQSILDSIENDPYSDVDAAATETAAAMGKDQEGWFFDSTPEQKTQLQEEIAAVRAVLENEKASAEERAQAREVLRMLTADDLDIQINALMDEHRAPQTSNGRRGEINREIAGLRLEQGAKRSTMLENIGITPEQKYDAEVASEQGVPPIRIRGEHYSHQKRTELSPAKYGTGYKGQERTSVLESSDSRLRNRVYFYADAGKGVRPEAGVGGVKHIANLDGIYPAHEAVEIQKTIPNTLTGDAWSRAFESAVLDAGYSGYSSNQGQQLMVVKFGTEPIPVLTDEMVEAEGGVVASTALIDKPDAPLLNVGLDVGAGARTMKINPATAKMIIENTGAKITRSNVVQSTYTHEGKEVTERTLVAELSRPLTETEANKVAALAQQEAISQRNAGDNRLYGPKAAEWGAFDPSQFVLLDGTKMDSQISSEDATVDEPISNADQLSIIRQPISPAHPNEVRVIAGSGQGWFERSSSKVIVKIQEQHNTLKRVVTALGIKAEDIGMDVLGAITRSKGLIQSNLENLVKDPLAKIESDLYAAGVKDHKDKIEAYLKYRHVPEANAQAAKISPFDERTGQGFNLTDRPGSGITTAEAIAELEKLDLSPDGPALRAAAGQFDTMMRGLQDYAVSRGLESADTIKAWRNVFPNYAPFYRDLDVETTFSTGAQGYSTRAGTNRRFMGSAADIQPVLGSVRLLGQRIVNRGETARVAQTLLRLASNNTPMFKAKDGSWRPMWKIDTYPNIRTVKVVNVYRFKDITGGYVKNGAGVPIEFYSQASADAYLETHTNSKGGPKQVESLGPQERVQVVQNPNYMARDNVVIVPMNGENVAIVFDDQSEDAIQIYRNLKNMDTKVLGEILTLPALASRWIIATATGYNPIFAMFNFLRDIQATAVNMNAENIPGWNGVADTRTVLAESLKNAIPLVAYLQRKQNKLHSNSNIDITPAPGSPAWWMEKAKAAGGLTGIMDSLVGTDAAEAQIRELFGVERAKNEVIDPAVTAEDWMTKANERGVAMSEWLEAAVEGEGKTRAAKAIGYVTTRIANLNQGAELATRTAAFQSAYEKFVAAGKSDADASALAAKISKGISVNFNRKGQWSGVLGAAYPFFNAAAQGSARFAESVFEKKVITLKDADGKPMVMQGTKLTPFGMKLVAALPMLGVVQALLLAGYDDDEIAEADKDRNFIIPTGNGGFIKIPLPLGLNVAFNMGREIADMVVHPENFARHAKNLLMQPLTGFNPLGGAGNFIQTMSPAIGDPVVALLQNRDAFDRPIAKEDFDKSKPTPGHTRFKEGASAFSKNASYGLNYVTGGGEHGIGKFSPTPDQIDYVLGQITGGVGRETMKAAQGIKGAVEIATGTPREEMPWYKVPVAGRFYGNVNEAPNVKAQIYEAKTDIAALKYEHTQLVKSGNREEAAAFLAEHPEIKLASRIDAALKEEAELRKRRTAAREGDDVETAQKANEAIDKKLQKLRDEIRKIRGG